MVKLFENLECHMILELRKKMAKELTLVLAERGRVEETALPTDLWKRPVSLLALIFTKNLAKRIHFMISCFHFYVIFDKNCAILFHFE